MPHVELQLIEASPVFEVVGGVRMPQNVCLPRMVRGVARTAMQGADAGLQAARRDDGRIRIGIFGEAKGEPCPQCFGHFDVPRTACFAGVFSDGDDVVFPRNILPLKAQAFCRANTGECAQGHKRQQGGRVNGINAACLLFCFGSRTARTEQRGEGFG